MLEARRLTQADYEVMVKALNLRLIDEDFNRAKTVWYGQIVQNTERVGKNYKPQFKKFKDFFDYDKLIEEEMYGESKPTHKKKVTSPLHEMIRKVNQNSESGKVETDV